MIKTKNKTILIGPTGFLGPSFLKKKTPQLQLLADQTYLVI